MIYFVEGNSVGSDFGFPRVDLKKRFRWYFFPLFSRKKMNFTTDLPKWNPFVTYIVASAVKCEKFFPESKNEGPSFRMHAVILHENYKQKEAQTKQSDSLSNKSFILCHIRKIDCQYKNQKHSKDSFMQGQTESSR